MNVAQAMQSRYATKVFDADKKIAQDDVAQLLSV
ncbi:MAG TPA: NAD(P)H nitroreductase, partial [Glaciecola sp.]|nr:NAD(P)H nitroreductase [Glaciecola sp.]